MILKIESHSWENFKRALPRWEFAQFAEDSPGASTHARSQEPRITGTQYWGIDIYIAILVGVQNGKYSNNCFIMIIGISVIC